MVADHLDEPNGLAFPADGTVLYVADSGANQKPGSYDPARPHQVVAYQVLDGRRLGGRRLLAVVTPGFPDGLKVDAAGRVYVSSATGVQVYQPDGAPNRTYDVLPHTGGTDVDDQDWRPLAPADTRMRLGNGRVSFIPARGHSPRPARRSRPDRMHSGVGVRRRSPYQRYGGRPRHPPYRVTGEWRS